MQPIPIQSRSLREFLSEPFSYDMGYGKRSSSVFEINIFKNNSWPLPNNTYQLNLMEIRKISETDSKSKSLVEEERRLVLKLTSNSIESLIQEWFNCVLNFNDSEIQKKWLLHNSNGLRNRLFDLMEVNELGWSREEVYGWFGETPQPLVSFQEAQEQESVQDINLGTLSIGSVETSLVRRRSGPGG